MDPCRKMVSLVKSRCPKSIRSWVQRALNCAGEVDECSLAFNLFKLLRINSGRMLDVGAHRGSSSIRFAEAGWKVCAFEPDPENFAELKLVMHPFSSVELYQSAIAARDCVGVRFYRSSDNSFIGSLNAFDSSHNRSVDVDTISLSKFCRNQKIKKVNFLKIDTEGSDLFVLNGFPWGRIKPDVIVCEFEDRKTIPLGYDWTELAKTLSNQGYRVMVSEWAPIVSYFGPFKWRRFAIWPCQLLEPGANGNLIAVREPLMWDTLVALCKKKTRAFQISERVRSILE